MTREERNTISRQRILEGACNEFALHGYAGATINDICVNGNISKGILYHYYQDKDALYLHCVQDCFDGLSTYMRKRLDGAEVTLEACFDARASFFAERPQQQMLFCDATFTPPAHLAERIYALKAALDETNCSYLKEILSKKELREGVTLQEALDFYRVYQNFANTKLVAKSHAAGDAAAHTLSTRKAVDLFLYGVIKHAD